MYVCMYVCIIVDTFIHSFIHSLTHSFIHSFTHSLIHSFIQSVSQSVSQSVIYSYIHPCIHTSIHPYIHTSIHPYIHACVGAYVCTYVWTHTCLCTYANRHTHTHICIYMSKSHRLVDEGEQPNLLQRNRAMWPGTAFVAQSLHSRWCEMPRSGWRNLDEALGSRNGGVTPIDGRFNGGKDDKPLGFEGFLWHSIFWQDHFYFNRFYFQKSTEVTGKLNPSSPQWMEYKDSPPSPAISATKETFASDDKSQPLWLRLGPALLNDCRLWIWVCPFSWLNIVNPEKSIQQCPCALGKSPVTSLLFFGTHDIFIWGRPARHRPAYHPGFKICCASHRILQIYEVQVRRESYSVIRSELFGATVVSIFPTIAIWTQLQLRIDLPNQMLVITNY